MTRVRRTLLGLVAALALVLVSAQGASSDAVGPSPGVVAGSPGVLTPDRSTRYVTLTTGGLTVVAAQSARGELYTWTHVKRDVGVPLVAFDGTTDGVSADGKTLVLASPPAYGPKVRTTFVVLRLPSLVVRRVIELDGLWAFDAISPNGRTIVAARYATAAATSTSLYAVRAIAARTGRVYPAPIVDEREPDEEMSSAPVARAYSPTRAWAYTLYVRPSGRGFSHALDTVHRSARCIDLPWGGLGGAPHLRLLSRPGLRELQVLQGSTLLARVNLETLRVKVVNRPTLG